MLARYDVLHMPRIDLSFTAETDPGRETPIRETPTRLHMTTGRRPRVTMVQAWVPRYRQGFHAGLRATLEARGVDFTLVYGNPVGEAATKDAVLSIPWGHLRDHRVLRIGSKALTWQPCLDLVRGSDLVIGDQAAARLINYVLLARHMIGRERFALWGHGANFQATRASRAGELVKRWVSRRVHWWFAYNELSAEVVRGLGFPDERITRVQNTIDTADLLAAKRQITDEQQEALRRDLGIDGEHVVVYVGGMYAEKRLDFLLEACMAARSALSGLHVVLIGTGPDAGVVEQAARAHDWIHYVGPRFEADKVRHLLLGKLLLMPGLVGLAVIDAFALELPLVTVADSEHSPEIAYLETGVNGVMLPAGTGPSDYGAEIVRLLTDDVARAQLVNGCRQAAGDYTMSAMVERFADGIQRALAN